MRHYFDTSQVLNLEENPKAMCEEPVMYMGDIAHHKDHVGCEPCIPAHLEWHRTTGNRKNCSAYNTCNL